MARKTNKQAIPQQLNLANFMGHLFAAHTRMHFQKCWPVVRLNWDLHQFATNQMMRYYACRLFCSYQYNDMQSGYNHRDIYFWQPRQIIIHTGPYVTPASTTKSNTMFFTMSRHLLIFSTSLWIKLSILLPGNDAEQFMFQPPHGTRDNLYLSMQALSYSICLDAGGEWICRHLICLGLVGKTKGASGVMCDFPFLSEAPGVILWFSSFFIETTWGAAHLLLSVRTHLLF